MKKIVNPYNLHPDKIQPGDVIVLTVTIHVNRLDQKNRPLIRAYRCPHVSMGGIPQGDQIAPEHTLPLAEALAPVLIWAGAQVDL